VVKADLRLLVIALVLGACRGGAPSTAGDAPSPTESATIAQTGPLIAKDALCNVAFAKASSVDPMLDTVEDLYPAVKACKSLDAWVDAARANPGAISPYVEPLVVLSNVCASKEAGLSATDLCKLAKQACKTNKVLAETVYCLVDQ